jgi:hypothetical protein
MLSWYCFQIFCSPLVTIPMAPIIASMTKHFMFYIRWIPIFKFFYFNFFSDSFCITFLSDGIATSISKQILSCSLLLCRAYLPEPPYQYVSLHSTELLYLQVDIPAYVCGSTSFLLFQCLMFYILRNVDVYRLFLVALQSLKDLPWPPHM